MEEEYWQSIHLLDALNQYSGYLDTQGLQERNEASGQYKKSVSDISHRLIVSEGTPDAAIDSATRNLRAIAQANPEWDGLIAQVQADLLARIQADSKMSVWRRRARYYSVPILIALAVIGYTGAWWYNQVPLDQPVTTVVGLRQHAMAFEKVVSYGSGPSRSGGIGGMLVRNIIEPTEQELEAARDFASLTGDAYGSIPPADWTCQIADPDTGEIDEQVGRRYIAAVAAKLLEQPEGSESSAKAALVVAVRAVDGCGEE